MPGLEDLYREIILDHYRTPRNRGELETPPAVRAEGFNPLCGDEIVVYIDVNDDGKFRAISELPQRLSQGLHCVFDLQGRMDVFLEAYTGVARGVVVDIAGLWLVDADGGRHPLGVDVSRLAADQLPGRQAIAGGVVPPLTYVALEVELVSARREQDGLSRRLPLLGFGEEPPEVPEAAWM